jgi:hypothetical protein
MSEQVLVPFEGGNSGTAGLTWGQWDILPKMRLHDCSFSISGYMSLPAGTTVADVAGDLRFLVCRYPALRTRLAFTAGGCPQQVAASAGEMGMDVVDAGDADPEQVAADLYRRYDGYVFDETKEWPVRWAAVTSGGAAMHLVWAISHLVADGPSMVMMLDDLVARDQATGAAAEPVTSLQPVELARWQASPDGQRKNAAALRRWERLLRGIPARRFAGSADPREPVYWELGYSSPASHLASRLLAARTGTSTTTVMLAGFAVALSRITGIAPAVTQVVMNNRYRRELAGTVSPLALPVPVVIDVNADFDEVTRRAWRRAVGAYQLSYYDPRERDELIARVSRERGEQVDVDCFVNDRRVLMGEPDGDLPTLAQVREALERSKLTWGWQKDVPGNRMFLHVMGVPDTADFSLSADTRYVSPADMEAFLRELETVLTDAALKPSG